MLEGKMPDTLLYSARNGTSDYDVRYEVLDGQKHIVVPVVMMREGVHRGMTGGPIYYDPEVYGESYHAWNGVPVTVMHPVTPDGMPDSVNSPGQSRLVVGRVYNVSFEADGGRLSGEVWVNEDSIQSLSPEAYQNLVTKAPMDVSTSGLFQCVSEEGEWEGEQYVGRTAGAFIPDHLALLPGIAGACSWRDGCGIRMNSMGDGRALYAHRKTLGDDVVMSYVVANAGYRELIEWAWSAVNSMDGPTSTYYLEEMWNDHIVYRGVIQNNDMVSVELYRQNYNSDSGNERIQLTGDPVRVYKNVTYEESPVSNQEGEQTTGGSEMANTGTGCDCPEKEAKIKALISAGVGWEDNDTDRGILKALSEDKLDNLLVNTRRSGTGGSTSQTTTQETSQQANSQSGGTSQTQYERVEENQNTGAQTVATSSVEDQVNDYLHQAPEDVRNFLMDGLYSMSEEKNKLVSALKDKQTEFTEDELKAMPIQELRRFGNAFKIHEPERPSYVGRAMTGGPQRGDTNNIRPLAFPGAKMPEETRRNDQNTGS